MPVAVVDHGIGRHPPHIESTVYFCCLEAVQNAAKHAGRDASVRVWLDEADRHVAFEVEDDGRGFDPKVLSDGHGLANISDRVTTASGTLDVDTALDAGTRITGRIPVL